MTVRQQLTLEAAGGLLLVAGLAMIYPALGIVVAGLLLVLAANFLPVKKEDDTNGNE